VPDIGDLASEREQVIRDAALAKRGLASRVTEIPDPHYDDDTLVVCRICGKAASNGKCPACAGQIG